MNFHNTTLEIPKCMWRFFRFRNVSGSAGHVRINHKLTTRGGYDHKLNNAWWDQKNNATWLAESLSSVPNILVNEYEDVKTPGTLTSPRPRTHRCRTPPTPKSPRISREG